MRQSSYFLLLVIFVLPVGLVAQVPAIAAPSERGRAGVRERMVRALALEGEGRCRAAGPLFERLWRDDALLRAYHAYRAAACALREGDAGRALQWAERVPAGSIPEAEARLIRLEVLVARRRWRQVLDETADYAARFPAGPRRAEVDVRRAAALEGLGRLPEAAALLRVTWAGARAETWSARAGDRLAALATKLPPAARAAAERGAPDWVARGMVLFDRHANEAAEAAFGEALAAPDLTPALECQARYHQAQSVWKQRQRSRALPLFAAAELVCRAAGDADLEARAMYQHGRCLVSTGAGAEGQARFAALEAAHPQHRLADDARLRAAEVAWEAGDEAKARALAEEMPRRYPTGDMLGEGLWRLAHRAYQAGDLAAARRWLEENRRLVPRATIWYAEGRAEYWLGRIAEKRRERRAAIAWYEQALRSYPLSVYALLSLRRLDDVAPQTAAALTRELRRSAAAPQRQEGVTTRPCPGCANARGTERRAEGRRAGQVTPAALRRAVELAAVGLGREAQRELARLDAAPDPEDGRSARELRTAAGLGSGASPSGDRARGGPDRAAAGGRGTGSSATPGPATVGPGDGDEDGDGDGDARREGGDDREAALAERHLTAALLLDQAGLWNASHALVSTKLPDFRRRYPTLAAADPWALAYPRAYRELVEPRSRENGVPAALQLALMREESAFDPRAVSTANCLGLTMLKPETARELISPSVTREAIFDPPTNIAGGSRHLAGLLRRFGAVVPAIAAYNAGPTPITRWLRERGHLPVDEFLETIPFEETRGYTKRVLASYFVYSWLYDRSTPVPPL